MIRTAIIYLAVILISACAAMQETPIRSQLEVYQYNSVARKYMDRPTMVSVSGSQGSQNLKVSFDSYGAGSPGDYVMFAAKHADIYAAHITKFLEWAATATVNGDAFDKKIGNAPILAGLSLNFTFHSATASRHYLELKLCSLGSCAMGMDDNSGLYFDESGARTLLSLMQQLKAGELPSEDLGEKYN